jgi:protein associated with RNAse G/E
MKNVPLVLLLEGGGDAYKYAGNFHRLWNEKVTGDEIPALAAFILNNTLPLFICYKNRGVRVVVKFSKCLFKRI